MPGAIGGFDEGLMGGWLMVSGKELKADSSHQARQIGDAVHGQVKAFEQALAVQPQV